MNLKTKIIIRKNIGYDFKSFHKIIARYFLTILIRLILRINKSKFFFTPSFGAGIYDDGSGKKLGNDLQFRTSFEISYELKNKNRIGISFSHISNANLGDKNPGSDSYLFGFRYKH